MGIREINYNKVSPGPTKLAHALVLSGSLLGCMLVLVGTGPYGMAVTPDSATYIASANSLLAGDILDFMRQGGLTNRVGPSIESRLDPSVDHVAPSTDATLVTQFEDGALYTFPAEISPDR